MGLMVWIQTFLWGALALWVPFVLPGPFFLPLAFWAWACLILPLEVPSLGLALMVPDAIAVRMSERVMHSATSSSFSGSIQTLWMPHLSISAASLFWLLRPALDHTILLRTRIPSSLARSSIATLFFVPTVLPMRAACFLGSIFSRSSAL